MFLRPLCKILLLLRLAPCFTYAQLLAQPKNVILIIADGMGHSQLSLLPILHPKQSALYRFTVVGMATTHSLDSPITDSAAAATAIATGKKTMNGAIGVAPLDGKPCQPVSECTERVATVFELAAASGYRTSLLVTSTLTHATPACFYAHHHSREDEEVIAEALASSEISLFVGGGRRYFHNREDKNDLLEKLLSRGYALPLDSAAFTAAPSEKVGWFMEEDALPPAHLRQPRAFAKSIDMLLRKLSTENAPFFLLIEASQVDWAGHDNAYPYLRAEIKALEEGLEAVLNFATRDKKTLVLFTSDHETGGLSIQGIRKLQPNQEGFSPHFSTTRHTAVLVPVMAYGPGAEVFSGLYDNTDIFYKIQDLLKLGER